MPVSIFAEAEDRIYKHRYAVEICVGTLVGGVPRDKDKLAAWIGGKLEGKDEIIQQAIITKQLELLETATAKDPLATVSVEEATLAVIQERHLNGFLGDSNGLYLEGRCVKAMLKESGSIRYAGRKWKAGDATHGKGTKNFFAEHVFVPEERIYLLKDGVPVKKADRIIQRFVHSTGPRGPRTSISTEEAADHVTLRWTIVSDYEFTMAEFSDWMVTGQFNGLGTARAQGYGTFVVTGFDRIKVK